MLINSTRYEGYSFKFGYSSLTKGGGFKWGQEETWDAFHLHITSGVVLCGRQWWLSWVLYVKWGKLEKCKFGRDWGIIELLVDENATMKDSQIFYRCCLRVGCFCRNCLCFEFYFNLKWKISFASKRAATKMWR